MLHFYEGRTIRGMGFVLWSLYAFVVSIVAALLLALAVAAFVGTAFSADPITLLPSLAGLIAAVCGLVILEILGLVLYCVGFGHAYVGRREYGTRHERRMDRALVFFILTAVIYAAQSAAPFSGYAIVAGTPAYLFSSPTGFLLAVGALLRVLYTTFAGLALFFGVEAFADAAGRRRLILALVLGGIGSVVGSVITIVGLFTLAPSQYSTMIVASALGGTGVAVISMVLFALAYREILGRLRGGAVPPALPLRPPPPWPYTAPYAYPGTPPPAPTGSPPPPSPPP